MQPKIPTPTQINNCYGMGWRYLGGGYFERGEDIGGFTANGWVIYD